MLLLTQTSANVDVRGTVTELSTNANGSVRMLVIGQRTAAVPLDRAYVTVPRGTAVDRSGGVGTVTDLRNGQTVEIRFKGPILESYPPQATAGRVRIVEEAPYATGLLKLLGGSLNEQTARVSVMDPKDGRPLAVATISRRTTVYRLANGRRNPVSPGVLRNGMTVSLTYDGPTTRSMPPQGRALTIVIQTPRK